MLKKLTSIFLCMLILSLSAALASCGGVSAPTDSKTEADNSKTLSADNLTEKIQDGAILHCFCWDFETIENSLEDIAAAGFSAIQTSPINECLEGENAGRQLYGTGKWYYHFQPTDYTIGNYQLGTRDEFKSMCEKADSLGVKVIVDVVPNHTTPTTSAVNQNLIDAVGGLDKLYHEGNDKDINNYGDRLQCTTYKMGGLPDIDTENKAFQDYFIAYLNDCIECGADGFRYDAAKHIALPDDPTEKTGGKNDFWTRVTTEIKDADRIFNYGEVLQGNNDRLKDYIDTIGACTASTYGGYLRQAVSLTDLSVTKVNDLRVGSNESCVTWVESHDNYINDGNWMNMDDAQVLIGYAVIAARAKGTPLFFARPYGNTTDNQWGTMNYIGASSDMFWRDPSVRAVNFFRNAMVGEDENMYNLDENDTVLEICRGDKGAVIINSAYEITGEFDTDLKDGIYVNRVDNNTEYTVKDGKLLCKDTPIPAESVVVLCGDEYADAGEVATVKITDDTEIMFSGDSVKVGLISDNSAKSTYSVNGGEQTEYKDGDAITLTSSDYKDGCIMLELRGESAAGNHAYMKYCFTNPTLSFSGDKVAKGDKITFEKPDSWGDTIYAYIYYGDTSERAWPGTEMTKVSGNTYTYNVAQDWDMAYIIFNDGENQYPGQNEQGLDLKSGGEYTAG